MKNETLKKIEEVLEPEIIDEIQKMAIEETDKIVLGDSDKLFSLVYIQVFTFLAEKLIKQKQKFMESN